MSTSTSVLVTQTTVLTKVCFGNMPSTSTEEKVQTSRTYWKEWLLERFILSPT